MPEKELLIQSFEYGLDTRRSELTSKPGSLVQCENGHVNQGAQIEKRKMFRRLAIPAGTFGIDSTLNGLVVYGSEATPSGLAAWPAFNQSWTANNVVPLSYLRLQAPAAFDTSAMTAVIWSTLFGGLPFIIASFASGNVYVFQATASGYTVVTDFYSGLVLSGYTTDADQAANLTALINETTNYTAAAGLTTGSVIITRENSASYVGTDTLSSVAGVISINQVTTASPGTTGLQATGTFAIQFGNSGTGASASAVSLVAVGPASQDMFNFNNILSAAVPFVTDAPTTAGLVAQNINANAGSNGGYSATANGGLVTIYAPIGSAYNTYIIYVQTTVSSNLDGAVCLENCQFNFFLPAGTPTLTITNISDSTGTPIVLTSTSRALSSFSNSLSALLAQVAKDINTTFSGSSPSPGTQPYVASSSANVLYVSRWYDAPATNIFGGVSPIVVTYTGSSGVIISGSGGLQGAASPKNVYGGAASAATTNTCTVTVAAGTAPYTYKWTMTNVKVTSNGVPLGAGSITVNNPTSNQTTFSASATGGGTVTFSGTAVCVITDNAGNTFSVNVGVTIQIFN